MSTDPNTPSTTHITTILTAKSQKLAAKTFNYGTLIAILIPFPVAIFWTGASMFVYAFYKHHPNPKVGKYTQSGASRFYAVAGSMVAIATFFPVNWRYYVAAWAVTVMILVPLTILDLRKINRDDWQDMEVEMETPHK